MNLSRSFLLSFALLPLMIFSQEVDSCLMYKSDTVCFVGDTISENCIWSEGNHSWVCYDIVEKPIYDSILCRYKIVGIDTCILLTKKVIHHGQVRKHFQTFYLIHVMPLDERFAFTIITLKKYLGKKRCRTLMKVGNEYELTLCSTGDDWRNRMDYLDRIAIVQLNDLIVYVGNTSARRFEIVTSPNIQSHYYIP